MEYAGHEGSKALSSTRVSLAVPCLVEGLPGGVHTGVPPEESRRRGGLFIPPAGLGQPDLDAVTAPFALSGVEG